MHKPLPDRENKQNKLDDRFFEGVLFGFNQKTGEYFIGTEAGVVGARTVKRLPPDQQWDVQFVNKIKRCPMEFGAV